MDNIKKVMEEAEHRNNRIMENAIEIAMNVLPKMVGDNDMPRDAAIRHIQQWAIEAEKLWEMPSCQENAYGEYYDFIDAFAERKCREFLVENGRIDGVKAIVDDQPIDCISKVTKRAKLVNFEVCARVVVPDGDDNTAMEQAIEDVRFDVNEYIHEDNIVSVEDDKSCPIKLAQEYIIITKDKKALSFQNEPYDIVVYGDYEEAKQDFSPANDLTIATLVSDIEECHIFVNGDEVGRFNYDTYTQNKVNGIVKSNFQYKLQEFVETHDFSKYLA